MNSSNSLNRGTVQFKAISSPIAPAASLTDNDLYCLCKLYGSNAKSWLRKFAGLLPEVYKRQLHRRHGCASIHEFAKKLAGMNERTVSKILNLHKRLQHKPNLLKLFESGDQGWSKLEAVAFVATKENEAELAEKVKLLPKEALSEYVRNERQKLTAGGQIHNNFQIAQVPMFTASRSSDWDVMTNQGEPNLLGNSASSYNSPGPYTTISFAISPKSRIKLDLIKHQLQKEHKRTLTYDEVIKLWPYGNSNWQNYAANKAGNSTRSDNFHANTQPSRHIPKSIAATRPSRHIPKSIQHDLLQKYNHLCAYPNCHKPYHEFHHAKRFAEHHKHNENHIFPLCKTHHTLAHAGLIANENLPPENWHIREKSQQSGIDKKVMKFKNYTG